MHELKRVETRNPPKSCDGSLSRTGRAIVARRTGVGGSGEPNVLAHVTRTAQDLSLKHPTESYWSLVIAFKHKKYSKLKNSQTRSTESQSGPVFFDRNPRKTYNQYQHPTNSTYQRDHSFVGAFVPNGARFAGGLMVQVLKGPAFTELLHVIAAAGAVKTWATGD